jgi:hypothetical protein
MSGDEGTSVRDRIAHYEFVEAGSVTVSADGIMLFGGGENFMLDSCNMTNALHKKTEALHSCITEVLSTFIRTSATLEANKQGTKP